MNDWLVSQGTAPLSHAVPIAELAKRNEVSLSGLFALCDVGAALPRDAVVSADLELKYSGYFARERIAVDRMKLMSGFVLSARLPYHAFRSLSMESRQKLAVAQPETLAAAARVSGVSPSDLQNLVIEVERLRRSDGASAGTSA